MTSFTEASRIIDEFVETHYPPIQEGDRDEANEHHAAPTNTTYSSFPIPRSRVPLLAALGRRSCATILAPIQMPLFDNSAMDGYALSSSRTATASPRTPLEFRVLGTIAAGDEPPIVGSDEDEMTCWGIMTGASFPIRDQEPKNLAPRDPPYDACVKLESVTAHYDDNPPRGSFALRTPKYITVTSPVPPRANRRLAGEDIRVGDVLLQPDEVLRKEHVMVLASMGVQDVEVYETKEPPIRPANGRRRLTIGIINTGKEVVLKGDSGKGTNRVQTDTINDPHLPQIEADARSSKVAGPQLGSSQIWNSNGPYIHAALLTWGFHSDDISVLTVDLDPGQDGDDPEAFQRLIRQAVSSERPYDILISTGGVSTGVHDYVPSSIVGALGGELGFHKLKMRPGGPMMFAHLANATGGRTAYFGLPGNPVAAAVCLRFMVAPALTKMRGAEASLSAMHMVKIRAPVNDDTKTRGALVQKKPSHTRMYVPARLLMSKAAAKPEVEALARGSNMTKGLMHADGWVCFVEGEGRDEVYEGDLVELYGLDV
ncbi:hypothetical protein NCC49_004995 [Naganishia albida]|nr:hypothetical protein NCC49_004995 [Naganishia albida]